MIRFCIIRESELDECGEVWKKRSGLLDVFWAVQLVMP